MGRGRTALLAAIAVAATSCGSVTSTDLTGAVPDQGLFFEPSDADHLARLALLTLDDLPTDVWTVVERDAFDLDDDDDGIEFDTALASEPACADFAGLEELGASMFGSASRDEDPVPGRAQIKFQNPRGLDPVAPEIDVEIEIAETVAEVEGSWALASGFFEDIGLDECLIAALNTAFLEDPQMAGVDVVVSGAETTTDTPNDGWGFAMTVAVSGPGGSIDVLTEVHTFPLGNAMSTVGFTGAPGSIGVGITRPVLDGLVARLEGVASGEIVDDSRELRDARDFVDPEGLYSVMLNEEWIDSSNAADGVETWIFEAPVDQFPSTLSIEAEFVPDGMTFDEFHDYQLESVEVFVEGAVVNRAETRPGASGERQSLLDFRTTVDGRGIRVESITVVRDGVAVSAILTGPQAEFDALRAKVEPYMLTLTSTA